MATIDDYLASRQQKWNSFISSGNIEATVSEIRQLNVPNSTYKTLTHRIPNASLAAWLSGELGILGVTNDHESAKEKCLLRVIWIPFDRKTGKIDVGHGVLHQATEAFHHHLAQSRFRATFAGVAPVIEPSNGNHTHWYCNHPHIAITWSSDPASKALNIIVIAQPSKVDILQDLLSFRFIQELAPSAFLPVLMSMILLSREIDILTVDVKDRVRQAEVRTGHHCFTSRIETPASGDLLHLSSVMSGCMSNLAVLIRRLGILSELKTFTEQLAEKESGEKVLGSNTIATILDTIRQHSVMQQLDIEFFKERTQIQQTALLHLIGEQDNLASRGIAKESHSLAVTVRKDTSTMKTLAVLSVVFVPPAFVSSLFSIPLFDWNSGSESSNDSSSSLQKKVLLYFSITCPLMLVTFSVWGFLMFRTRSQRGRNCDLLEGSGHQEAVGVSETISLIAKRQTIR